MSMIERVSRAMCRHRYEKEHMVGLTVSAIQRDLYVDKRWREYEGMARVAMKAMRITDYSVSCPDDIIDAGRNAFMEWEVERDDHKPVNAATVDCWNAMLQAALHGDQEG